VTGTGGAAGAGRPLPGAMTTADLTLATQPEAATFTAAMRELASGVVLVTSLVEGRAWGMTVTAFASVSADPPTVLVSLGSMTASARSIEAGGSFGVSLLGQQHRAAARRGSRPGGPKFLEPFGARAPVDGGSPVLPGALAHLDCEVVDRVRVADHTVFFGRVREVEVSPGGRPLVYAGRAYRALAPPTPTTAKRSTRCRSS
jgi:flavin reductase (DIM6/NTAB) family NADH-FMN oxidoreductase RutF